MPDSSSLDSANENLSVARRQLAGEWHAMRESLRLETGTEPRWSANLIWPVLALAAGVAAGAGIWWRRSQRG